MSLSLVRSLWRAGILGIGALHTAVACLQQSMGADGLNYLTIGSAYWRGDWDLAINGIWSPLYGVLAAGALELVEPPTRWVFPTVQIVNFLIFLLSLLCFERLWRELRVAYEERHDSGATITLQPWLWWSTGYALFAWAALDLIQIWSVTPDMLVAALAYLSASYVVRVARGVRSAGTYVALGATLGVGYLAKAPMFPLGLVALALTASLHARVGEALRRMLPAVAAFAAVAGPLLVVLSLAEGRPTFSEVSRFTYLKHVNRIPYPHWRDGAVEGIGTPRHPPLQVHSEPDVFVYSGPVGGAYPPSFDPDYWTEGLEPRVGLFEQANEIGNSLAFYFGLFFGAQGAFLGVFALLAAMMVALAGRPSWRRGDWALCAWAAACFAMYSLVFVTERYVAPFVVLLWGGLLSYWRFPATKETRVASTAAGVLLVSFALTHVIALNLAGLAGVIGFRPPIEAPAGQFQDGGGASPPHVADALRAVGVEPGTDVAHIGYSFTALWAYLADVRIVADIWPEQASLFWRADAAEREAVLSSFREAGARHVVSEIRAADRAAEQGWIELGDTGYLVRSLD
jgi:hypothetical protein